MLETLDYTIHIGSTPTFLYFDLYLYSAYAAHYVYYLKSGGAFLRELKQSFKVNFSENFTFNEAQAQVKCFLKPKEALLAFLIQRKNKQKNTCKNVYQCGCVFDIHNYNIILI